MDQLLNNPLTLVGGGLLIALLAGLAAYRARKRKEAAEVDSAFLESRLQPDSFFGASGGQRVDTNDGQATGSSMVYSPSQLDAADDVDPVAEADVYLAYGRDVQAEEILKEALRSHPGRIAIHQKLLDIYAKRRDTQGFETMAKEAFRVVGADSPEWARICEQGQAIDPPNPLYRPGSEPNLADKTIVTRTTPGMAAAAMATQKIDLSTSEDPPPSAPMDLDLDLDFSLDDEQPASVIEEAQPSRLEPTVAIRPPDSQPATLDVSFGDAPEFPQPTQPQAPSTSPGELPLPEIDKAGDTLALASVAPDDFRDQAAVSFGSTNPAPLHGADEGSAKSRAGMAFDATAPNSLTASQTPFKTPDTPESGMLEFDLGTLSLDLDAHETPAQEASSGPEDPLVTKLALAEEFVSIGDDDGARALIEEVLAEASGDLKAKAQRALNSLG
jgi:pilus assembly protein FimV